MTRAQTIDPILFSAVHQACSELAVEYIGADKTARFFKESFERVRPYFPYLEVFSTAPDLKLHVKKEPLADRELLAFAAWMRVFINRLQEFLVGLGHLDIREITQLHRDELEAVRFYEYFQQAEELKF